MPNTWSFWGYWDAEHGGTEFPLAFGKSANECWAKLEKSLRRFSDNQLQAIEEVWTKKWVGDEFSGDWYYVRKTNIKYKIQRITKASHEAKKARARKPKA